MAEIKREPGPAAEFQNPRCGMCGAETDCDSDGFDCGACGIRYEPDGAFAAWHSDDDGDDVEQCQSRAVLTSPHTPATPARPRRCRLARAHSGWHAHSWTARWGPHLLPYDPDRPGGWRSVTPEQAEQLQAAHDAFIGRAVSRG